MMTYFLIALKIIVLLYFLDRLCLWLEKQGLLYYRKRKRTTSGLMGNILLEMQNILNPSTQNVIEVKKNKEARQNKKNTSDF